jgi:hypothetical protein
MPRPKRRGLKFRVNCHKSQYASAADAPDRYLPGRLRRSRRIQALLLSKRTASRGRDAHASHWPPAVPAAVRHMVDREPSANQAGGQSARKTSPEHYSPCVAVRFFGQKSKRPNCSRHRGGSVSSTSFLSPIPPGAIGSAARGSARSRHPEALFNHLVSAHHDRWGYGKSERLDTAISNFVGNCTGRSPNFAGPLRAQLR